MALSKWVREGYAQWVNDTGGRCQVLNSWRFWSKGAAHGLLAWGILKDSSDTMGRPHPLLVLTTCQADRWQKTWEKLPLYLDRAWRDMEQLTMRRFQTVQQLQEELLALSEMRPVFDGKVRKDVQQPAALHGEPELDELNMELGSHIQLAGQILRLPICVQGQVNTHGDWQIGSRLRLLRQRIDTVPTSCFAGGPVDMTWLFLFYRPLCPRDFLDLWSVSMNDTGERNGYIQSR